MNPYLEPSVLFAIVMAVLVINACSPFLTVVSTVLFSILNVIIFLLFDYISSTYEIDTFCYTKGISVAVISSTSCCFLYKLTSSHSFYTGHRILLKI
ncbi:uncharacterized protein LOC111625993 isoform X2 [Centruroides sculpturatus]|uniref:uncharacterized protein LOC111625993 isoform X2 n=1 Tax=Centruroides sculpturatus TaxID=218467 RepID=UPI000C6D8234|nr:uncharacterized protein LOC111625993 isoform X2 [Centruroides sculpturatus]